MYYRFLMILTAGLVLLGCQPQGIATQKNKEKGEASESPGPQTTDVPVTESNGTLTGKIDPNSTQTQVIKADQGALSGTSVAFPPGSVALDTEVSVSQGEALASDEFFREMAVEGAVIQEQGVAVVVDSPTGADPVGAISITIPAPVQAAGLTQLPEKQLVVVYKNFIKATAQTISGIIPDTLLVFHADTNTVSFENAYFGQFQALYTRPLRGTGLTAAAAGWTRFTRPDGRGRPLPQALWPSPCHRNTSSTWRPFRRA